MKTFPTLYQKTNTGAIQQWTICVDNAETDVFSKDYKGEHWAVITTEHGQVGGKLQTTSDTLKVGKNPGKANATSPYEQAFKEAEAKWTKQKKKGYVESKEKAEAGEVDEAVIKGGVEPMLAPSDVYPHYGKDIKFPCFTQPKFDGNRCIAIVKNGKCTLWTRSRKAINSVPHIVKAIERACPEGDFIFDGELYNHNYRDNFEDLMSLIRVPSPRDGHEVIEYHVYDLPSKKAGFAERHEELSKLLDRFAWDDSPIRRVRTLVANNKAEIFAQHEQNLDEEYEGTMVRNDGPYEGGRRSRHLQKLKTWKDAEYKITGFEEGRGKDAGTVGAFVCITPEGKEFKARLKATYDRRRELFGRKDFIGKDLTVKYQNLTGDGIPRFPIGKAIRDYE